MFILKATSKVTQELLLYSDSVTPIWEFVGNDFSTEDSDEIVRHRKRLDQWPDQLLDSSGTE